MRQAWIRHTPSGFPVKGSSRGGVGFVAEFLFMRLPRRVPNDTAVDGFGAFFVFFGEGGCLLSLLSPKP